MTLLHDRTGFHVGTEDTETTVLAEDIGRYPAGMSLQDVLEDMAARLSFTEANGCDVKVLALTADAQIVSSPAASFTADAIIFDPAKALTLDAVIFATTSTSFTADAFLAERQPGYATLVTGIDADDTTIIVSDFSTFPLVGPIVIIIGSEHLLVTAGLGTSTWTVTRGHDGTTAAPHPAGSNVTEEC